MANTFQLTWTNSPAFETFDSVLVESAVGEDVSWTFSQDSGTTDVSAWTIQFDVAPSDNRNPVFTILNAAITKSIGGNISFPTLKAKTETLPPRSYYWELIRTDSGSRKVLSFGNWKLIGSPSLFPGVTVPPTIIPTNKGGTGSDLSDDGPSVIVQLALGANLTALPADLSNTVLFLRKDLTWQTPSGAGIGTVTSVSVVTANGVSGSVATATSTPAITISLGAITPTSVAATGNVTGTNLSGTNTGDQTNISGNAATVSVIDAGADTTCWLLFANSQTGNLSPATNANATFNAATGVVSLASPAFSGTPTAPTATLGTNTTQLATTAFVLANASTGTPTAITVANEATDTTCFPGFFTAATGDLGPRTNASLTFNSNTANLGCTTFTGALVGNASTATLATNATNSAITNDTTTNATMYPTWVTTTTGNLPLKMSSTKLTFNPSTGNLTATMFTGALVGNADTATLAGTVSTNANLTGPITSSGNATSIASQTGTGTTFAMSAGPTFTGIPAAPTASPGTNTTQLATTAFVAAAVTTGVPTAITVANEATDTTCFPLFATAATGDLGPKSNAALTFNSNTANLGCTTFTGALVGNATTATTLATSRNLWGQAFTGAADVTGSLTSVADITGGASSMTITAGTGASRTLVFKTTTSGSTATTALTLAADQSATFANTVNATTFVGALTGNASTASAVAVGGITGLGTGVATALAINVGSAGAFVTFNGAGGTPSSITLTNGTALPIAGLTASTSTALGVGSIELGHATDTSITRSAAGKIAVEGKAVPLMNGSVDAIFAGPTATRTYTFPDADTTFAAAVVGANPSASVGLAAVNGSASTFLRSDGSPALDQTAAWKFTQLDTTVFSPVARSSGVTPYITVNAPADTALTASTEAIGINFVGATRQHATGALTTQREVVFSAPTYGFVGSSTITTAATLAIAAAPIAGTNATITNAFALWVQSGMSRLDGELGLLAGPISGIAVNINSSSLTRGFNCNISTGGTTNYGVQISLSGGATTNYGVYTSASGATNNNAIYISSNTTSGANNYAVLSDATAISKFAADIQITTVGTGSTSAVTCGGTQTFTGKTMIATTNVVEEITSTASSATPTPTGGSLRNLYTLTALAAGATFAAPSGSPVHGNYLTIVIIDSGSGQTLAWNGIYRAIGVTLPLSIAAGKTIYVGCKYNSTASKWDAVSVATQA